MALQAQAGATPRVTLHIMWIIIDTILLLRQGAHIIVPRRMNHSQGIGEIIIEILHLLHQGAMPKVHTHMSLHQGTSRIGIAMSHLHRLGAMTRVHMHMNLHQGTLRSVIDILPRGIIIAIVRLMTVTDIHLREIIIAIRHMRRPPMVIHQDPR